MIGQLIAILLAFSAANAPADDLLEAAARDPDFALQGEYTAPGVGVQVVARGKGEFLVVDYRGGLPGAGYKGQGRQENDEDRAGVQELVRRRGLKKVDRRSPTLGAAPPSGAVVLFDGAAASLANWQPGARLDGSLLKQGCTTRATFGDFVLHVEFRLPFMPQARGQGRGNSGVYCQGRYETQMLDSFGLEARDDDCGGLYKIHKPDVNMCLPPLAWQTYDVEFAAARWKDGKKASDARITVRHNGVLIQQNIALPFATTAAPLPEGPAAGPIHLQDHGNEVRYRNIWILPRSADREGRRPIVAGFERFHSGSGTDAVAGGRLLMQELNCVACHAGAPASDARKAPELADVGKRIRPEFLAKYFADPHGAKAGATMPDVLARFPAAERTRIAVALTNFLVGPARPSEIRYDLPAARRGEALFRQIGCVACHAPRDAGPSAAALPSSIPLPDLHAKYSIASLASFLAEPHKARPSGRMPTLVNDRREAMDLACCLVGPAESAAGVTNVRYWLYRGSWNALPDFSKLKLERSGQCVGFDLSKARRDNDYAMRFEGYLKLDRAGEYTFHLGSDDGSNLYIDGKKVVDCDGVHAHQEHVGKATLFKGTHHLRVDYFQDAGEQTLELEYEGPGTPRQDVQPLLTPTADPPPQAAAVKSASIFQYDPELVDEGRKYFQSLGCANCHQLKRNGQPIPSTLSAPESAQLKPDNGCLAASPGKTGAAPDYGFGDFQREALAAAVRSKEPPRATTHTQTAETMTAFNCYACHSRGGVGGPERERNASFQTTVHEIGDEGRLPPPLDGVGDKLNDSYLRSVLEQGRKDRPYVLTRMPKFHAEPVKALVDGFIALDRKPEGSPAPLPESALRAKAAGRFLAGDKSLGCVKCHTFGERQIAGGVRAMDLQVMSDRLREDWFRRYMIDPQAFRPGTRMPTGFPKGVSAVRDLYSGDTGKQLSALWEFLRDGRKAAPPDGITADVIELKPTDRPILYRNFIEGVSPRGIAVGYPEGVHLAWDAEKCCLALGWHGRFMDAGKHWEGRGSGFQGPLGDLVLRLDPTTPVAVLGSPGDKWPDQPPFDRDVRFLGYSLDAAGRPKFKFAGPGFSAEDALTPVVRGRDAGLHRKLTVTAAPGTKNLFVRVAVGSKIVPSGPNAWVVDESLHISAAGATLVLRDSEGKKELLAPIDANGAPVAIEIDLSW